MILSGRWAYKKYKKGRAKKKEVDELAHTKHRELLVAAEGEIFKTAVEDLGPAKSTAQQSDKPPSYTKFEDAYQALPQQITHSTSSVQSVRAPAHRSQFESYEEREAQQPSICCSQPSLVTQRYPSSHNFLISPPSSRLAANEIQVHGRWVWVSDERSPPDPPGQTPGLQLIPGTTIDESAVAERHSKGSLAELSSTPRTVSTSDQGYAEDFVLAELDGAELRLDDPEKNAADTPE